jgi:U2-associated protein SR140
LYGRILFTSDVTDKLRSILNGASAHPIRQDDAGIKSKPSNGDRDSQLDQPLAVNRFKKATAGGFKSTFVAAGPAEAVSELAAGVTTNEEDLDGEEMEDLDGEQLDEDLDGDAMEEEEDLDGEAM